MVDADAAGYFDNIPHERRMERVEDNGLRLHPDKTHVGGGRHIGEGFAFLGPPFEAGLRWRARRARFHGDAPKGLNKNMHQSIIPWASSTELGNRWGRVQ